MQFVFVIYDESKAVPQGPSHDKVSQKHALTGEHLAQKRNSNKSAALLLKSHFGMDAPAPLRVAAYPSKHS